MATASMPMHSQPAPGLKGPLVWSIGLHAVLFTCALVSTVYSHRGDAWSGTGGGTASVSVKLVGGMAGVPLPRPEVVTTSRVVDTSKGLYKSEPKPKPVPSVNAKQIPEFSKEKQPKYMSKPSRVLEDNAPPPPPNAVPYGGGGSPNVPYTQFSMGTGGATAAGMGMTGTGGGGGDFGGRFSWYVDAVRSRVSSNWLQSTVDPSIRFAPRAVVTFDILRNGSIANVQILQSSGNRSVDDSALRAISGSNPVNPLPGEYSGSKVSVEFWFDFKR